MLHSLLSLLHFPSHLLSIGEVGDTDEEGYHVEQEKVVDHKRGEKELIGFRHRVHVVYLVVQVIQLA